MSVCQAYLRQGFTLIETMVAISLGMLVIIVAMAGFRVTSQSLTTANRLALENNLLRAGFHTALNEVDFWTAYDDPDSTLPGGQLLRQAGMPFCPMPTTPGVVPPSAANDFGYSDSETDTGWDYLYAWPASARRTWWRANAAEWHPSKGRSGDYSKFAAAGNTAPHTWLFNQMDILHKHLGYYGYCDYLPPSMLYAYIGADPAQGGKIDMMREFTETGTNFRNTDGQAKFAQGRYRCTKDTSYLLVPLQPLGGSGLVTPSTFRSRFNTGYSASTGSVGSLMQRALSSRNLMDQQPAHWPNVKVQVARFLTYGRFVTLNKIVLTNPITGNHLELSFTALGTTLRGARQQRKPGAPGSGAGWAAWWGPNDTDNDRHLDQGP